MDTNALIHKLDKARTKDDLEDLGIKYLGIDVDKRKAKEVLRAELIGEAESRVDSAAAPEAQPADEQDDDQALSTEADTAEAPDPAPAPAAPASERKYAGKMGRNRNTGRVIPWTAAMAKMPHMEEM